MQYFWYERSGTSPIQKYEIAGNEEINKLGMATPQILCVCRLTFKVAYRILKLHIRYAMEFHSMNARAKVTETTRVAVAHWGAAIIASRAGRFNVTVRGIKDAFGLSRYRAQMVREVMED